MAIPEEFLARLKDSCDIVSTMQPYVTLKRAGRDHVCLCPFHSEKTPSCHVYTESQSFYCFGCGAGGDSITFIRLAENLDYVEAVKLLAEKNGMTVPESGRDDGYARKKTRILEMNREAARFYRDYMLSEAGRLGLDYYLNRGLTPNTLKKYGLGYAPKAWETLKMHMRGAGFSDEELVEGSLLVQNNGRTYDKFRNRVVFPIIDRRGNVIGFSSRVIDPADSPKYLNSSETAVFQKRENLFSLNFAKNSREKYMILCEGNLDVIALNQAGFPNAVATLGTAVTSAQARLMRDYCEEVVIAYDADEAGQKATIKAINLLAEVGLTARVLQMDGAKDPDEYLQKYGRESFLELIEGSGSAVSFELTKLEKAVNMDTTEGRAEYMAKAVEFIAKIDSEIERKIHASAIAMKCGLAVQSVESSIEGRRRKKAFYEEREQRKTLVREGAPRELKKAHYSPEEKAQRGIIAYIFHSPDKLPHILAAVTPGDFTDGFYRNVLESLVLRLKRQASTDLSSFGSEFSAEEVGRIEGIKRENMLLPYTLDRLDEYIKTLLELKAERQRKSPADMSEQELRAYSERLREKRKT